MLSQADITPHALCCQYQTPQAPARKTDVALVFTLSTRQRSIQLILDHYNLAMLPIAHLTRQIDPFDRYCTGSCKLDESYRSVVNAGVRAYQLHTYSGLIQQYFGPHIKRHVFEHQLDALDGGGGKGLILEQTMELIVEALSTAAVTISSDSVEVEVPMEMNIALLLLLGTPQSPDYVSDPSRRPEQISHIGMDVDWRFAEVLTSSREDIKDTFQPILETTNIVQHSTYELQFV